MDEIDLGVAGSLMREHGDEALYLAKKRADDLLNQGDTEGFIAWLKVVNAIETLRRKSKQ